MRLRIAGRYTIDAAAIRARPRPGVAKIATDADDGSASVIVTPAEGFIVTGEREDGLYLLDVARKAPAASAKSTGVEIPAERPPRHRRRPRRRCGRPPPRPRLKDSLKDRSRCRSARAREPSRRAPPDRGSSFPFARLPAAALFERGGLASSPSRPPNPSPCPLPAPRA